MGSANVLLADMRNAVEANDWPAYSKAHSNLEETLDLINVRRIEDPAFKTARTVEIKLVEAYSIAQHLIKQGSEAAKIKQGSEAAKVQAPTGKAQVREHVPVALPPAPGYAPQRPPLVVQQESGMTQKVLIGVGVVVSVGVVLWGLSNLIGGRR
jgi:hypothetical protein